MAELDRFLDVIGNKKDYIFPGDTLASHVFVTLENILITVWRLNPSGVREASPAIIYSNRAATAKNNPWTTAVNGRIDFFASWGEYEIDINDQNSPDRIANETWHWSSVPGGTSGIALNQLPNSGGGVAQTGDLKIAAYTSVGGADPTGFLWTDGRVFLRTAQQALFNVIGTAFNIGGETATQFRIPDLRGRVPNGSNSMGTGASSGGRLTSNSNLGNSGGEEKHLITIAEMPVHTHVNTLADGGHQHAIDTTNDGVGHAIAAYGGGNATPEGMNVSSSVGYNGGFLRAALSGTGISLTNVPMGGGVQKNNMQPHQTVGFLIKT